MPKAITITPIADLSTAEMVAEYNALTGKTIKKFSSRAAGEKQLEEARQAAQPAPKTKAPKAECSTDELHDLRSQAVAATWQDANIAARRKERSAVEVKGHGEFRSVKAAFDALELPLGKHITFRLRLKQEGSSLFVHDGKKYEFTIV